MSGKEHWCGVAYRLTGPLPKDYWDTYEQAVGYMINPHPYDNNHIAFGHDKERMPRTVALQRGVDVVAASQFLKDTFGVEIDTSERKFFSFSYYNGGDNPLWNTEWDDFERRIPDTGEYVVDWNGIRITKVESDKIYIVI